MSVKQETRAPIITRVTIRRFKKFEERVFDLKPFNLLVGPNNRGKTTLLQALSAWQLAYSSWRAARRVQPGPISKNVKGVPISLPNFHAVPLADFKHLWTGKQTQWFDQQEYKRFQKSKSDKPSKKYQGKYTIEIVVEWTSVSETGSPAPSTHHFGMALLYENEQSILVKPTQDTEELPLDTDSIILTHIPPFSGLDAHEEYLTDAVIRRRIGLSQPGSVVRNLLWRVFRDDKDRWAELKKNVERYLGVQLQDPRFAEDIDPHITCEYLDRRGPSQEPYDLVNGGSGFHQLVTIFAILYWSKGSHLLLDEPDAHLHAWAQAGILEFLKDMAGRGQAQIIIATHSLAMLDRCKPEEVYSFMTDPPAWLIEDKDKFSIRSGLDAVETSILTSLDRTPCILYVEGTSDIEILRLLARGLGKDETLFDRLPIHVLGGRDPKEAREHFLGVKSFKPSARAICVLDPDLDRERLQKDIGHNQEPQLEYHVWRRRHLESYLLAPEAIGRAILSNLPLFEEAVARFAGELRDFLAQPPRAYVFPHPVADYRTLHLDWMETFDAKRQIFSPSSNDASFLVKNQHEEITPAHVARAMLDAEIHDDVREVIERIYEIGQSNQTITQA